MHLKNLTEFMNSIKGKNMLEVKEVEDTTSSEDLLIMDLGKNVNDIYKELDTSKVNTDTPSVLDAAYYIQKLDDLRQNRENVQALYVKVIRAKATAQTRLTNRETRYDILMSGKLENSIKVKSGVSVQERTAIAANELVELKNALRESKNEVEILKGLEKVLNLFNKNYQTSSADVKQQARLVELELSAFGKLPQAAIAAALKGPDGKPYKSISEAMVSLRNQYNMTDPDSITSTETGSDEPVELSTSIEEDGEEEEVKESLESPIDSLADPTYYDKLYKEMQSGLSNISNPILVHSTERVTTSFVDLIKEPEPTSIEDTTTITNEATLKASTVHEETKELPEGITGCFASEDFMMEDNDNTSEIKSIDKQEEKDIVLTVIESKEVQEEKDFVVMDNEFDDLSNVEEPIADLQETPIVTEEKPKLSQVSSCDEPKENEDSSGGFSKILNQYNIDEGSLGLGEGSFDSVLLEENLGEEKSDLKEDVVEELYSLNIAELQNMGLPTSSNPSGTKSVTSSQQPIVEGKSDTVSSSFDFGVESSTEKSSAPSEFIGRDSLPKPTVLVDEIKPKDSDVGDKKPKEESLPVVESKIIDKPSVIKNDTENIDDVLAALGI